MDTIARFITVRNPAKRARAEMKAGFITYDRALGASLADEASADEDAARRRAVTYANGKEFARTLTELRDRSAALYDLGELLELPRDGVTKKDLDAFVKDHDVVDDPATVAWLWDNLVAHWFADGPTEVRDAIIWMLRAARVADHIDDKNLERPRNVGTRRRLSCPPRATPRRARRTMTATMVTVTAPPSRNSKRLRRSFPRKRRSARMPSSASQRSSPPARSFDSCIGARWSANARSRSRR